MSASTPKPHITGFSDTFLDAPDEQDGPLNMEEMRLALHDVPLFVIADNDPLLLKSYVRAIKSIRQKSRSIIRLDGDNMEECFDRLPELNARQLPLILCASSEEAEEATRIICKRRIQPGILALDHDMNASSGMSIFEKFRNNLPPKLTRILQTSNPPLGTEANVKSGLLDASVGKFGTALPIILRAFMTKTFGETS